MTALAENFRVAELGNHGTSHTRARLADGLTLSRLVLERIEFSKWKTGVFIAATQEPPLDLESGGAVSAPEALDYAAEWLSQWLDQLPDSFFLAEDRLRARGDPHLVRLRQHLVFGNEIYHLASARPSPDDVRAVLMDAEAPHGVSFFAGQWPDGIQRPAPGADIERHLLEALASRVSLVGVDAYDGETYVLTRAPS